MNAVKSKRTGSVLMKSTLPEQTCQALIPRQLNNVLKQWPCQRHHRTDLCHWNTKEWPRYWWRKRTRSR